MSAYNIVRPIEYNIGAYQPGLTESAVNIFKINAKPTDFNENRASWNVRSPGLNTLLSSQVFISFDLEVRTNTKMFDYLSARSANTSYVRRQANNAPDQARAGSSVTLCFGEGNPFAYCLQQYSVVINGASLQQVRMDEWKNTVDKLWLPSSVMARRFGRCGGAWNAWDSVCVSGDAMGEAATTVAHGTGSVVSAFTQDSGIAKRIQGVLACTFRAPALDGQTDVRTIRVRAPLDGCGLMNPLGRQDYCSSACPLKNGTFCIPHANVIQFSFLMKNMFKVICKNLSSDYILAAGANVHQGGQSANIEVRFPGGQAANAGAQLELSYLRLPSWRSIPATRTLSAYRVACHDATSGKDTITGARQIAAGCLDSGIAKDAIGISGVGRAGNLAGGAEMVTDRFQQVEWAGINMSQIPTALAFVLQKSTDAFTLANGARVGNDEGYATQGPVAADVQTTCGFKNQFIARNTASSASIVGLDLMVQSSVGSYVYSESEKQFLKGRSELFADTIKNSYLDYMGGCEFKWDKHNCIVYLESSDYARGLGSEGSSMPVVFNAKVRFENHREFIDGTGAACDGGRGCGVVRDAIFGTPLMLAIYSRMSIALSPSAGLVSSQNISHSSALQLLSQTQG